MKTYNLKDFNNVNEMMAAMATELSELLANTKVTGKFGDGTILSAGGSTSNFGNGFITYIEFNGEVKQIRIDLALKSGAIKMPEDKVEIIKEFMQVLTEASVEQLELDRRAEEERKAAKAAELEAEKERIKQEKMAAKFEERKQHILAGLDELSASKLVINSTYSAALGWLAKNMTSIQARMPDFCESWFRKQFGNDVKAIIVDSTKKTTGGYAMQWGLSLTCGIKTSALDNIPEILKQYLSESGKDIRNTQFIYSLLTDCGFKVGKASEQDLNDIKYTIPADELESFEAAYAA